MKDKSKIGIGERVGAVVSGAFDNFWYLLSSAATALVLWQLLGRGGIDRITNGGMGAADYVAAVSAGFAGCVAAIAAMLWCVFKAGDLKTSLDTWLERKRREREDEGIRQDRPKLGQILLDVARSRLTPYIPSTELRRRLDGLDAAGAANLGVVNDAVWARDRQARPLCLLKAISKLTDNELYRTVFADDQSSLPPLLRDRIHWSELVRMEQDAKEDAGKSSKTRKKGK